MRSKIAILILCCYLIAFNTYIYELTRDFMTQRHVKLLYNYTTWGILVFFFVDRTLMGIKDFLHDQFNMLCFLSAASNGFLIILTHHGILNNAQDMFIAFNGAIFVLTAILFINMIRHGYFKK